MIAVPFLTVASVGMKLFLALLLCCSSSAWAYLESPALAEQVKAGKLPPVDKRLPQKPLVVTLVPAPPAAAFITMNDGRKLSTLAETIAERIR